MFDESFIDELADKVADRLATRAVLTPETATEPDPDLVASLEAQTEQTRIIADADVAIAEARADADAEVAHAEADALEAVVDTIVDDTPPPPPPVIVDDTPDSDVESLEDLIEDVLPGDPEDAIPAPDVDLVPDTPPMPDVKPKPSHWFQRPLR